jgi:hypothetical protein
LKHFLNEKEKKKLLKFKALLGGVVGKISVTQI